MDQQQKESMPVEKLLAHPQEALMFGDLPSPEFAALKDSIEAHGLRQPILPDGTILAGHQRLRAVRELGK